jgi:hypothetical protein
MEEAVANLVAAQKALDDAVAAVQNAADSEISAEPQWAVDVETALVNDGWTAPATTPAPEADTDQS